MAQFRMESRVSYISRTVRFETGVSVRWVFSGRPRRRAALPRDIVSELSSYTTPAELGDLEAALDRYGDEETAEIRSILAGQALRRLMSRGACGLPGS